MLQNQLRKSMDKLHLMLKSSILKPLYKQCNIRIASPCSGVFDVMEEWVLWPESTTASWEHIIWSDGVICSRSDGVMWVSFCAVSPHYHSSLIWSVSQRVMQWCYYIFSCIQKPQQLDVYFIIEQTKSFSFWFTIHRWKLKGRNLY